MTVANAAQRCLHGPHQPEIVHRYAGKFDRNIYPENTLLIIYSRCWLQGDRLVVSLFSSLLDQGQISVLLQTSESKSMFFFLVAFLDTC